MLSGRWLYRDCARLTTLFLFLYLFLFLCLSSFLSPCFSITRVRREWFTLSQVSRYARPFINMFAPNDGASILRAEDGPSIDM